MLGPDLAASLGGRLHPDTKVAAALQHPHWPRLDSGGTGDLLTYVMPYVEGESLRDRLTREAQLPIADAALDPRRGLGDALAAAHAKGIVHRDIKPQNADAPGPSRPGDGLRRGQGDCRRQSSAARLPARGTPRCSTTIGVALAYPR